jgi:hypothetical protein
LFRFSGKYIYSLANTLAPIGSLTKDTPNWRAHFILSNAIEELHPFLNDNPFGLHSCLPTGFDLLSEMKIVQDQILKSDQKINNEGIGFEKAHRISSKWLSLEATLKADLDIANFYVTTPKGAFNTFTLAESGLSAFPKDLEIKVADAAHDAKQAARCLAFDLPTAAAFHMHRAHESVVHTYFNSIAPANTSPPIKKPLSEWIKALENLPSPDLKIIAAIRDINGLHRNPVLHPDHTLADSEEAMALLGAIGTSITHMLKAIK